MYAQKGGASIQRHPFFSTVNFDELGMLKVEAPWKPDVSSEFDTRLIAESAESHKFDQISEYQQGLFAEF